MRAGKYNDDVEILLGFNEEEGHMVSTRVAEKFLFLINKHFKDSPLVILICT